MRLQDCEIREHLSVRANARFPRPDANIPNAQAWYDGPYESLTLDQTVSLYTGKLEADLNQIVGAYQALLWARAPLMLAV
jgi:hypothetical protein